MAPRRKTNTSDTLRALTYGRVSTGKQAEHGVSLGDQEETLAAVVLGRGWTHLEHVTDAGLSGKRMSNRPGLSRALDLLDAGDADVLIASKIDRVSRSTEDFARLLNRADRHGWKIVVLDVNVDTSTAAGRLVVDVVAAAAQFESKRIGERVASAHAVRRSQGKRAGQAPILPAEVRVRIASEHAAGASLGKIARDLTADGVSTAKGGRWFPATISQVLRGIALDKELAESRDRVNG